jgi:hypothetical protein
MSPRSSRDGVNFDETYSVLCVHCGMIGQTPKYDVASFIDMHYNDKHRRPDDLRDAERVLVEGVHFTSYRSPNRCDSCSDALEPPYWWHVSDPPTSVPPSMDSDGIWLVCDTCHDLWVARDLVGLVRQNWAMVKGQSPGMVTPELEAAVRVNCTQRYRLLFERWDEGTRIALG